MEAPSEHPLPQNTLHDDQAVDEVKPSQRQPRYPTLLHVAVVSALVLPLMSVPYLASRRRINTLQRQLEVTRRELYAMQANLGWLRASQVITRQELRSVLETANRAAKATEVIEDKIDTQVTDRKAEVESIRSDVQSLREENQHLRYCLAPSQRLEGIDATNTSTQAATLRALGMSLADIAAFMDHVELGLGIGVDASKQRGVDRLRLLALRMQSLPQSHKTMPPKENKEHGGETV